MFLSNMRLHEKDSNHSVIKMIKNNIWNKNALKCKLMMKVINCSFIYLISYLN